MTALKVALVGAGNIASHHLPAYTQFADQVELVAVCDLYEDMARARAEKAGVDRVFRDVDTLLRDVDCDALDICTTPDQHASIAHAAIAAGKHVLVEKPFALTLAECRELVDAADRAGVTLMVAQNQRFLPTHQAARAIIASGELGEIRAVRTDSVQHWGGFVDPGHWQYDGARAGGGAVIGVAVHRLDLVRFLVGDVQRVSATVKTASPQFVNGAEEYAAVTLEFENGALGQAFATVSAYRTPWSEQLLVFGERGTIHASPVPGNMRSRAFVASERRSAPVVEWADQFRGFEPIDAEAEGLPSESGQVNEILHFAACCASGAEPLSSGRDNIGTMRLIAGIYESARAGEPVELADL
jgi:UDP-N-acetylglucosamine 3-dehydrogenase